MPKLPNFPSKRIITIKKNTILYLADALIQSDILYRDVLNGESPTFELGCQKESHWKQGIMECDTEGFQKMELKRK